MPVVSMGVGLAEALGTVMLMLGTKLEAQKKPVNGLLTRYPDSGSQKPAVSVEL